MPVSAPEDAGQPVNTPLSAEPSETLLWLSGEVPGKAIPNPLDVFAIEIPWVIAFDQSQVPISKGLLLPSPEAFRDLSLDLASEPIAYLMAKDVLTTLQDGETVVWVIRDYQVYTLGYAPTEQDMHGMVGGIERPLEPWNLSGLATLALLVGGATHGSRRDEIAVGEHQIVDATGDEDRPIALSGLAITGLSPAQNVTVTLSVTEGQLQLNGFPPDGLDVSQISGNGTARLVLTGTVAEINASLAFGDGLLFVGPSDFFGSVDLSMQTTGDGIEVPDSVALIQVQSVNDAPVLSVRDASGQEDTPIALEGITISDLDESGALRVALSVQDGLLFVDTDVPGGVSELQTFNNGSATVELVGTLAALNATLGAATGLTYLGKSNFNGSDQLVLTVVDSEDAETTTVAEITVSKASGGGLVPGAGPLVIDEALTIEAYRLDGALLARVEGTASGDLILTDSILTDRSPQIDAAGTRIALSTQSDSLPVLERLLIDFGTYFGPTVFVVREGTRYVDEATARSIELDQPLRGYFEIPEGDQAYVGVTPLSEAAFRAVERSAGIPDGSLSFVSGESPPVETTVLTERYASAASLVQSLTGVDIQTDLPILVNSTQFLEPDLETTTADNQYGMKLAALSEAVSDLPTFEKIEASVDLLLGGLDLSTSDDEPIVVQNPIALVDNQVAITEAFVSFRDEGLSDVQPDLPDVSDSVPVVDLTPPVEAALTGVLLVDDQLSVTGVVDLIDQRNQAKADDSLEFRIIVPDGFITVTLDEVSSSEPTVDLNLSPSASVVFSVDAYDPSTGILAFSLDAPVNVETGSFDARFVVVDPAAHATANALSVPLMAPSLHIALSKVVLGSEDQALVTFEFDQPISDFSVQDIVTGDPAVIASDLVALSESRYQARITVDSDQVFLLNTLSVDQGAVVSAINGLPNQAQSARYLIRSDLVQGGATDDIQIARIGDRALSGGGGDDSLLAGDTDILLDGDTGDDLLVGGIGHDTFIPGDNDDLVFGGDGDDLYYADVFGQFSETQSWFAGGSGDDQALFLDPLSSYRLTVASQQEVEHLNTLIAQEVEFRGVDLDGLVFDLESPVARVELRMDGESGPQVHYIQAESLMFADATLALGVFTTSDPQLIDYLALPMMFVDESASGVALNGLRSDRERDDFGLTGSAFDDTLIGGLGSNLLLAGDGDDVLMSITGDDTLLGEGGRDTFWVSTGQIDSVSQAVLVLGGAGQDRLVLFDAEQSLNEPLIVWQPPQVTDPQTKVIRFGDFELGEDTIDLTAIFDSADALEVIADRLSDASMLDDTDLVIDLGGVAGVNADYQQIDLVLTLNDSINSKDQIDFSQIFVQSSTPLDPLDIFMPQT